MIEFLLSSILRTSSNIPASVFDEPNSGRLWVRNTSPTAVTLPGIEATSCVVVAVSIQDAIFSPTCGITGKINFESSRLMAHSSLRIIACSFWFASKSIPVNVLSYRRT